MKRSLHGVTVGISENGVATSAVPSPQPSDKTTSSPEAKPHVPKLPAGFYPYEVASNLLKLYGFDAPILPWRPFGNSSPSSTEENLEFSKRFYVPISPFHGRFFGVCPSGTFGFLVPMLLRHPVESDAYCFVACKICYHYETGNMLLETSNNLAYSNTASDFMLFPFVRLIDAFLVRNPLSCKHCKSVSNLYSIFNKDDDPSASLVDTMRKSSNLESTNDYKIYSKMTCCPTTGPNIPPSTWWFFWFSLIKSTINISLEENPFVNYYHMSSSVDRLSNELLDFGSFCKRYSGNLQPDGSFCNTMFKDINAFIVFSVSRDVFKQIDEKSKVQSEGGGKNLVRLKLPDHVYSETLAEMLWKEIGSLFSKQSENNVLGGIVTFVIPTECYPFSFTFFEMSDYLLTSIHGGGGFTVLAHLVSKIPECQPSFVNHSGQINMKLQNSFLRDSYLVHSSNVAIAKESTFFVHSSTNVDSSQFGLPSPFSSTDCSKSIDINHVYFRKRYQLYNSGEGFSTKTTTNGKHKKRTVVKRSSLLGETGKILFLVTLDKKRFIASLLKFTSSSLPAVLMWFWDVVKISAMEEYSRVMTFVRSNIMTAKKSETSSTNLSSSSSSASKSPDVGSNNDLRKTLQNLPSNFQYQLIAKVLSLENRLKRNNFLDGVVTGLQNFDSDCNFFTVNPLLSSVEQENRLEFLVRFTSENLVASYQAMKLVVDSINFSSLLITNNNLVNSASSASSSSSAKSDVVQKNTMRLSVPKLSSSSNQKQSSSTSSSLPDLKQGGFKMSSSFTNAPSNPNSFQTDSNISAAARDLIRVNFFQSIYAVRALHAQKLIHADLHRNNFVTFSAPTVYRTKFSFYKSTSSCTNSEYSTSSFCDYYLVPFGNPKVFARNNVDSNDFSNLWEMVAIPTKYFPQTTVIDFADIRKAIFSDTNFFVGDALYTKNKLTDLIENGGIVSSDSSRSDSRSSSSSSYQKIVEFNFLPFLNSFSLGKLDSSSSYNGLNIPRSVVYNCYRNYLSRKLTENAPQCRKEPFLLTKQFCTEKLRSLLITNYDSYEKEEYPNINSTNIFKNRQFSQTSGFGEHASFSPSDSDDDDSYSFLTIQDCSEYFVALFHRPTNALNSRSPEQFEVLLDKSQTFSQKRTSTNSSENNVFCFPFQPLSNMVDIYSLGIEFMHIICGFDPIFSGTSLTFRRQESLCNVIEPNLFIAHSTMKTVILPKPLSFVVSEEQHNLCDLPNIVGVLGNAFKTKTTMTKESGLDIFKIFQQLSPTLLASLKKQSVLTFLDYQDVFSEFTTTFSLQFSAEKESYKTIVLFDFMRGFLPENFRVLSIGFSNDVFMRDFCSPKVHSLPENMSLKNADVHFSKTLVKNLKSLLVKYCIDANHDMWIVSVSNPVCYKNIPPAQKENALNETIHALLMRIDACGLPEVYQKRLVTCIDKIVVFFSSPTFFEEVQNRLENIKSYKIFAPTMPPSSDTDKKKNNNNNKLPRVDDSCNFFFAYSIIKPKPEFVLDRLFSGFLPYWMDREGPLPRQNPRSLKTTSPNSDYLSQPVGSLDIVFKVITNSVFEVFLQYVFIETIIIGLSYQDKQVLSDFEKTVKNNTSPSLFMNLNTTSLITYGCKILTELESFVKLACQNNSSSTTQGIEIREKRPSTLEFIKLNAKNRSQKSSSVSTTTKTTSFWTLFTTLPEIAIPSSILYSKLVTFKGYVKPTLKTCLHNKFGFDYNSTDHFASLITHCLSWDPFQRCSTLELLHSPFFDVLKLPKSYFDIVATAFPATPLNGGVDNPRKVSSNLNTEHVLSITPSQFPILCQKGSYSFNDISVCENKYYVPFFSSDMCSVHNPLPKNSNNNNPLWISSERSRFLKHFKSVHTVENIFNGTRGSKFVDIVKKLRVFLPSFQKTLSKNNQNGFIANSFIADSLPEISSWITNNIGTIMMLYGQYFNSRHCEYPDLQENFQRSFFRIMIQTGFLSPFDKRSLFNSFYSNFSVLPVSLDAGRMKNNKTLTEFVDCSLWARNEGWLGDEHKQMQEDTKMEDPSDRFYIGPFFVNCKVTDPDPESSPKDEFFDREAFIEDHLSSQIMETIKSSSNMLLEFLVISYSNWILANEEGRNLGVPYKNTEPLLTFEQFVTKNYSFFLDGEKYTKVLDDVEATT